MLSTGVADQLAVSIWSVPGSNAVEIYFTGAKGRVPQLPWGSDVNVQLGPHGEVVPATASWNAPQWTVVLVLKIGGHDFVSKFAQSNELKFQYLGKSLDVGYDGAAEAARTFQQCIDTVVPMWGIDPAALAALKVPPEGEGAAG